MARLTVRGEVDEATIEEEAQGVQEVEAITNLHWIQTIVKEREETRVT